MNKRLLRKLNFHDLKCLVCGYVAQELWELIECDSPAPIQHQNTFIVDDVHFRATVHVCKKCGELTADELLINVLK